MMNYNDTELALIEKNDNLKKIYSKILEEKLKYDLINSKINTREIKKSIDNDAEEDNVEIEQPTF